MGNNSDPEIPMKLKLFELTLIAGTGVILIMIFFPIFAPPTEGKPSPSCLSNLKQFQTATQIYLTDSNDRLPLEPWMDDLRPYVKNEDTYRCTELKRPLTYGYAYHSLVVGKSLTAFPSASTVLFFETDALGRNVVANLAARNLDRHDKKYSNVAYVDGHAKKVRVGESP